MLAEFGLGANVGGKIKRACATSSVMSCGALPPHLQGGCVRCLLVPETPCFCR